jgi:hypothetical protein
MVVAQRRVKDYWAVATGRAAVTGYTFEVRGLHCALLSTLAASIASPWTARRGRATRTTLLAKAFGAGKVLHKVRSAYSQNKIYHQRLSFGIGRFLILI